MLRALLIGPLLAVAAAPGAALGATVGVDTHVGRLVYRAAPGERNDVRIAAAERGRFPRMLVTFSFADSVPIVAGSGCAVRRSGAVRCTYRYGSLARTIVRLGDRGDSATLRTPANLGAALLGGEGHDDLAGGRGNDLLAGGPGDDSMSGGAGADTFDEDDTANGSDEMLGGGGPDYAQFPAFDRVDYSARRSPVRADLSGDRDDGERGERDRIGADVEGLSGGRGADRLTGNASRNQLAGRIRADVISGGGGEDRLFAGRPSAIALATTNDELDGGPGSDALMGSAGANLVTGGPDADLIYPGDGADTVRAGDGAVDVVQCSRGDDLVRGDPFEFLLGCERHTPYSDASGIPLEVNVADNRTSISLVVGCRENHPATCAGTVQLELGGEAISPELTFSGPNRHRYVVTTEASRPLPPRVELRDDFIVRVRARSAAGAPTNDAFAAPTLLNGSPFF